MLRIRPLGKVVHGWAEFSLSTEDGEFSTFERHRVRVHSRCVLVNPSVDNVRDQRKIEDPSFDRWALSTLGGEGFGPPVVRSQEQIYYFEESVQAQAFRTS